MRPVAGAVASPNIWRHPDLYEVENDAVDPEGRLAAALVRLAGDALPGGWAGRTVLDLGCGTGYHLAGFAASAARVVGVEPHPALLRRAARRLTGLDAATRARVDLLLGTAQTVPLPASSVDVVHARWAYFFGPGCEPGLAELERVVRPGGIALVIDNDPTRSTFGAWFRRGYPHLPPAREVERFWAMRGWSREPVDMGWRFATRADLEAVVRLELPPAAAETALRHHEGLEIDYAVNVWWRRF